MANIDTTTPSPTPPHGLSKVRVVLLASAAVIALAAVAAGLSGHRLPPLPLTADRAHAAEVNPAANPSGFADLIAKVQPAVFSVRVEMRQTVAFNGSDGTPGQFFQFGAPGMPEMPGRPDMPGGQRVTGEGSGFFISANGYAVTVNHVIDNAQSVEITTDDGSVYKADVVGSDPATDLALLKIDADKTFTYVDFAAQPPRVGDWIVAIGNPYGLGNTATAGIVSALGRDIGTSAYDNFLQIDAPINQGNSGGPTFDMNGEVVGINDAIFTPSGGSVGIGFDIPADTARMVTAQLEKSGHVTRAWLGVQIQDVTRDIADSLGMADAAGALVTEPQAGSPAADAGVKPGDVITAVDGTAIKDARGLAQEIATLSPGTSVKLDILRSGTSQTIDLTLETMPERQQMPPA